MINKVLTIHILSFSLVFLCQKVSAELYSGKDIKFLSVSKILIADGYEESEKPEDPCAPKPIKKKKKKKLSNTPSPDIKSTRVNPECDGEFIEIKIESKGYTSRANQPVRKHP
jgi:hypothetical protein